MNRSISFSYLSFSTLSFLAPSSLTRVTLLLLLTLFLTACGRDREEATPVPTDTPLYGIDSSAGTDGQSEPEVSTTESSAESDTGPIENSEDMPAEAEGLIAQVNAEQLQFRLTPGEDGAVVRLLDLDERFVVVGQNGDGSWIKLVRHGEAVGWVATEFVTLSSATAEEIDALTQPPTESAEEESADSGEDDIQNVPAITPNSIVIIDADYLNVRTEPQVDSDISLLAQRGQSFDIIGSNDDGTWLQIAGNGEPIGWISREFALIEEKIAEETVTDESVTDESVTGETVAEEQATDEATADSESDIESDSATDAIADSASTDETTVDEVEDTEIVVVDSEPASSEQDISTAEAEVQTTALLDGPVEMNGPDFGAQAFLWWRSEIADRDLNLMGEAGFNWVKQTFAWEDIEGTGKGTYQWSIADRVVQQVNGKGLKLLARVSSDPAAEFWGGHPPGNATDYAEFIYELAKRYNCTAEAMGCIHAFQIWNEPNLAREWGDNRPNPIEYTAFLGRAYNAVKVANPNAVVINAGMAPTGDYSDIAIPDTIFYEQMYEAMGGSSDGFFDMLGVHGAGFAAPPELDPADAALPDSPYGGYRFFSFRHVEDIREIMVQNGDEDKQIVLLEFGWTYDSVNPSYKWHGSDAGIDAALQGKYLLRAYEFAAANWKPWIGLMSLLTMPNLDWIDDGNPEDEEQYWWAILEPSSIDQLYLRPAYVELCIYFNRVKGQSCIYDPN